MAALAAAEKPADHEHSAPLATARHGGVLMGFAAWGRRRQIAPFAGSERFIGNAAADRFAGRRYCSVVDGQAPTFVVD